MSADLEETEFDSPLGSGTDTTVIFGATGDVMDAALRSAYYLVKGQNPDPDAFTEVRGSQLWKLDAKSPIRFSHENPDIQELYRAYLKKPLEEKAYHLLHTEYDI